MYCLIPLSNIKNSMFQDNPNFEFNYKLQEDLFSLDELSLPNFIQRSLDRFIMLNIK